MVDDYYADLFDQFITTIVDLRDKYIEPFLRNRAQSGPEEYSLEVKAFCVFSHAALEFLFESWSIAYSEYVVTKWKRTGTMSRAVAALMLYYGESNSRLYETSAKCPTYSELTAFCVEGALGRLHDYINLRNHGIDVFHIRHLFWPLGIAIASDQLRFQASLARLRKVRGSYAHTLNRTDHIAPEDAENIVSDCVDMAGELEAELSFETFGIVCDASRRKLLTCLSRVLQKRSANYSSP